MTANGYTQSDSINPDTVVRPTGLLQKRYIVNLFLWFCTFFLMFLRVDLSVAIVAMVNQTAISKPVNLTNIHEDEPIIAYSSDTCEMGNSTSNEEKRNVEGEFEWDKITQGMILSSFFYGYIVLQIIGGWMASQFSAKWTIGSAMFTGGLASLFIPLAARAGYMWLMAVRVIQGLGQGVLFPAMSVVMANWFPPNEVVYLSSLRMSGAGAGLVSGQVLAGFLCEAPGWPSIFYLDGTCTILWFIAWTYFIYERPSEHPTISKPELDYLQTTIGKGRGISRPTPWCDIFKSPATYACIAIFVAYDWCHFTIMTSLPQYMNDILHFTLHENGLLSALPYIGFTIVMVIGSKVMEWTTIGLKIRNTLAKKVAVTIGFVVTSVFLISLRYLECSRALAVVFVTVAFSFQALVDIVVSITPIDLTRHHAGVIHGIGNMCSGATGTVAPFIVGVLMEDGPSKAKWMTAFYITCGIGIFANVVFVLFGSSQRDLDMVDLDLDSSEDEEYEKPLQTTV